MIDKKINILFLNDSSEDVELLISQLKKNNVEIDAKKIIGTIEKLKIECQKDRWDIYIIYELNTFLVSDALKLIRTKHSHIPVIIVSDNNSNEILNADVNCFVLKENLEYLSVYIKRAFKEYQTYETNKNLELKLRESKLKLNSLIHFANKLSSSFPIPYFHKDKNGIFVDCNNLYADYLGVKRSEIIGKNVFDIAPYELAVKCKNTDDILFSKQNNVEYETQINFSDNVVHDIVIKKAPILNDNGIIIGIIGLINDISDQKIIQEQITKEKNLTHLYFQAAGTMLLVIDNDGNIVKLNKKASDILGVDYSEAIGLNWFDNFIPDNENENVKSYFKNLLTNKSEFPKTFKNKLRTKKGDIIYTEWTNIVLKNADNTVTGILCSGEDVTEKVKAKESLSQKFQFEKMNFEISKRFLNSENFDQKIKQSLKEICLNIDAESANVIFFSKENNINYEWSRTEGKSAINIITNENIKNYKWTISLLKNNEPIIINDISNLPDEAEFEKKILIKYNVQNYILFPIILESDMKGFLGIVNIKQEIDLISNDLLRNRSFAGVFGNAISRKITEDEIKNVNKKLFDKNDELEQVIYTISHDFRTPLVNIMGFGDELNNVLTQLNSELKNCEIDNKSVQDAINVLDNETPELLKYINKSSEKIDKLLYALLKLSRLGRAGISLEEINMNQLITNVLTNFEYIIKDNNIETACDNLPNIISDEVLLNQIFSNLIDNAIKYKQPDLKAKIKISGYNNVNETVFCVSDNGIGISEKEQKKIFGIFYRINPYENTGQGMGLTIITKVIGKLNGKIWVESKENKGTSFFVSFPNNL